MHIHIGWVIGYLVYMSALSALPEPQPSERLYSFAYKFAHALAMNLDRAGLIKHANGSPPALPQ